MRNTTLLTRHTTAGSSALTLVGVPAALIGTIAGGLVAAPASAAETAPAPRAAAHPQQRAPLTGATQAPPATYTVQPGDTVFGIAERFGLRTSDVLAWNALTWRSVIHPGQTLTLTGAAATPAATATPAAPAQTHTVVPGDTLFGIARTHGTTVDALLAANGLTRDSVIYPGQKIAIGVAAVLVAAATPLPASAPAAAPSSTQTHTVTAGDTLFGIAARYGTTTEALFALNGLGPGSIIYPGQTLSVAAPQGAAGLDAEQAANAALIIRIGRELGVPDRGIAIALATSMVESWLRNLDWGDRDSLGLFQQRPSTGWGSAEQVRDAERSIRAFYGGSSDPNGSITRGLLDVPGWESMPFSAAAQAVQISAYPDRYGLWEAQAHQWLAQLG